VLSGTPEIFTDIYSAKHKWYINLINRLKSIKILPYSFWFYKIQFPLQYYYNDFLSLGNITKIRKPHKHFSRNPMARLCLKEFRDAKLSTVISCLFDFSYVHFPNTHFVLTYEDCILLAQYNDQWWAAVKRKLEYSVFINDNVLKKNPIDSEFLKNLTSYIYLYTSVCLPSKGNVVVVPVHPMRILDRTDRSTTCVRQFTYGMMPPVYAV
jgi:hypothetical protein